MKRRYIRRNRIGLDATCQVCMVAFVTKRTIQDQGSTIQYRYCPCCGRPGPKTSTSDFKWPRIGDVKAKCTSIFFFMMRCRSVIGLMPSLMAHLFRQCVSPRYVISLVFYIGILQKLDFIHECRCKVGVFKRKLQRIIRYFWLKTFYSTTCFNVFYDV